MYLELVGKLSFWQFIFAHFSRLTLFYASSKVESLDTKNSEAFAMQSMIFCCIFCRPSFSALRINFVRLSCGFICNLFLYLVHKAICKQLTWNIGAQKFARPFSVTIFFHLFYNTKSWVIKITKKNRKKN